MFSRKPEMFDNLVILNLQYFKRDSYISVICQAVIYAAEGRKADAVTHLAIARSQNTGNGILGILQMIKGNEIWHRLISFPYFILQKISLRKRNFMI